MAESFHCHKIINWLFSAKIRNFFKKNLWKVSWGDWLLQNAYFNFHTSLSVNQILRSKFLIYKKLLFLQMRKLRGLPETYPLIQRQKSGFHFPFQHSFYHIHWLLSILPTIYLSGIGLSFSLSVRIRWGGKAVATHRSCSCGFLRIPQSYLPGIHQIGWFSEPGSKASQCDNGNGLDLASKILLTQRNDDFLGGD